MFFFYSALYILCYFIDGNIFLKTYVQWYMFVYVGVGCGHWAVGVLYAGMWGAGNYV
jgi:hypothetical protein